MSPYHIKNTSINELIDLSTLQKSFFEFFPSVFWYYVFIPKQNNELISL